MHTQEFVAVNSQRSSFLRLHPNIFNPVERSGIAPCPTQWVEIFYKLGSLSYFDTQEVPEDINDMYIHTVFSLKMTN